MSGRRRFRQPLTRLVMWLFYATMPAVGVVALLIGFVYSANPALDRPLAVGVAIIALLAWMANHPHRFEGLWAEVIAALRAPAQQPVPVRVRSTRR